jgi:hypothetical protein
VYLQGALERAMPKPPGAAAPAETVFVTVEPRPEREVPPILDPFAVHAQSEELLRRELSALADWRLRDIARAFALVPEEDALRLDRAGLAERIVAEVRARAAAGERSAIGRARRRRGERRRVPART